MYFKITNKEENHNGLQYQDGVVKDSIKFNNNPKDSCCPGGIYFSDKDNILNFIDFGIWIRQVEIPENTQWLKDPQGNKWRAEKLMFHPRRTIWDLDTFKWMHSVGINLLNNYFLEKCIQECIGSDGNGIKFIDYLINHVTNIHYESDYFLKQACTYSCGNLELIKFLVNAGADINVDYDSPIKNAVCNNNEEVVRFLLEKGANVNACHKYIKENENLLFFFPHNGSMTKLLLSFGASYDYKTLKHFYKYNYADSLKVLLEHKADKKTEFKKMFLKTKMFFNNILKKINLK